MSPLPKFKCIYDIYGDSTKYYIITLNEDYLKTVQYRHIIFSKYDSIENKWQSPIDSICEKEDSVLLSKKSQDSLFFFIEKGIRKGKNRYSYISTNTSKISLNWKGNIYKLQYDNLEQRSIISFLKKHSSIPIRWKSKMRIMHISEVLQWCGDVLHLRTRTPQAAEPDGQRRRQVHHGQWLCLRCRKQRAQCG